MISWYFIMNHVINYSFIIISWYFIINILHVRHFRVPWRTLALRAPEAQRRQPRRVQAGTSVEQQKLPQLFHCLRQRLEKNCEKKMSHKYIYIYIYVFFLWNYGKVWDPTWISLFPSIIHMCIYIIIYIYISTVFSIVFSRAKSTTPPTLHESSSKPQGSDRKGMKRSSGSNQTVLNHAKHPIESRPSVVPYLGRHQQASPWITGNQRSLRFANMCCLVVTSLLSNLAWKDMEKQKPQLQTWKHAAFLQETSTKSDTEDRNWNGFTDGATWTTKPQHSNRKAVRSIGSLIRVPGSHS